ncbi:tRNA-modifying protein YgfZ [uncultured Paraglaciecola sp.]|uniref:tRNA-modifying protein YgfZ n=1 Tax=uncultured Paraglaciecola sp. TaxID=1765024 RepID=UPI002627A011|nr:tRNA-modifying protein YgfZ [uncultured Paraglaciecola sp.]
MSTSSTNLSEKTQYTASLKNLGVIQLTGEEKTSYLQGQITADTLQLTDNKAVLACHCDFKGKLWSVFYTLAWQDSILLIPHLSVLEKSLSELNKYGVFAKVEITNQTDNWHKTGGSGPVFEKAIKALFDELPTGDRQVISNSSGLVMSIAQPHQRYLVLQPRNAPQQLNCEVTDNDQWEMADIKAGFGDIRETTINEYVPQMLNLQQLNAIDFEKGCYMGQEVVARTKYLGRNKRAGFILKSDVNSGNLDGEHLEYQIGENWRPGGKILRSASSQEQTWIFAVLANDTEVGATFRVKTSPSTVFTTQALPYPL